MPTTGIVVDQLPPYSPNLNPIEEIWSLLRGKLANTAFTDPDHLINAVRRGLREIQYRPQLIEGVLTETGPSLHTETPRRHHAFKLSNGQAAATSYVCW